MRTISFQTLFNAFASQARVGRSVIQAAEKEQMVGDLNEAALWLWEEETATMALPDMMVGKTVTLGTDGVIAAADIDDASFWSVWKSDPREQQRIDLGKYHLSALALGNGDVKVVTGAAGQEVFVIYKSRPPQWTDVEVVAACSYSKGSLVLSGGKVYQALFDEAPGSDLGDTSQWEEVLTPQSLQRIIVLKANSERMRLGAVMPENAGRENAELERAVDQAFIAAANEVNSKPWLMNQNQ